MEEESTTAIFSRRKTAWILKSKDFSFIFLEGEGKDVSQTTRKSAVKVSVRNMQGQARTRKEQ